MEELKSNSNKSRSAANNDVITPDKKVEKVVAEKAQIKKKNRAMLPAISQRVPKTS